MKKLNLIFIFILAFCHFDVCRAFEVSTKTKNFPPLKNPIKANYYQEAGVALYEGTYIGQFAVKYEWRADFDKPWQKAVRKFNITLKLRALTPVAVLGIAVYNIMSVRVTDTFFGATTTVGPSAGSLATLPVPPQNISKQDGLGINIVFPDGSSLTTENAKGHLHVSSDGRILSNALVKGNNPTCWIGINRNGGFETILKGGDRIHRRNEKYTWALTRSAL